MKIKMLKRFGTFGAALVLAGAGLLATTTAASAQAAPGTATTLTTSTVFDLNGTYSDGGSRRMRVTNLNDIITVDMSAIGRPNATGVVLNSDTILITFPDDATLSAKLRAPGTIRWSNGSAWIKTRPVPNLRYLTIDEAAAALNASGFQLGSVVGYPDRTCNFIGVVGRQNPSAGAAAIPGSRVNVLIGERPGTLCP